MQAKLAILQVADQGPLESLVVMLNTVGLQCATCSLILQGALRSLGCDTVLDHRSLTSSMGYDAPIPLPEAGAADMERRDVVYVDVKAHRNGPLVWNRWPHLEKRTLWYRINGGKPEHVVTREGFDCGDEVNPPCPVLTPNQWYRIGAVETTPDDREAGGLVRKEPCPSYACWPPFYRILDYREPRAEGKEGRNKYGPPLCLIHGINGWGYRDLIEPMRALGVRCHGAGAPDGLLQHREIPTRLSSALCMVHLKSNDAPGYAIYEAMAAGCPVVCTQRMIWRCRMHELLEPGVTCLTFDHNETHDGLTAEQLVECTGEVKRALELLSHPEFNRKIGEAGRERLKSIMWSEGRAGDVRSLEGFMVRNFDL